MILKSLIKKIVFAVLLFSNQLYAQDQHEFWSKLNVIKEVNKHWSLGADLQYRRQSNYLSEDKNIFQYNLENSIRLWIYYKLPVKWELISSPIAYFKDITLKNKDGVLSNNYELRTMLGASKRYEPGHLKNINRVLYELSFLNYNSSGMILRHRYRLFNSFHYPIKRFNEKYSLNYYFFNEVFYRTEKGISSFDQDHLFNGLQWKWKESDINIGYQYTYQKSLTNTFMRKNQLYIFLNLTFPNKKVS
jgi:hypothetical protein